MGDESVEEIAAYFRNSFYDYFLEIDVPLDEVPSFLHCKRCLEYGPGDVPGVALLMYAYGAEKVFCVDRFPLVNWSARNIAVLDSLISALPNRQRERAQTAFVTHGLPSSGFAKGKVDYLIHPQGLSGLRGEIDFAYSRAVLEHVNDLGATFRDLERALRAGGLGIHLVDLRSHGLHRAHPLDFLAWPERLWRLMYSEKGVPNRWRTDQYRRILQATSLTVERLRPVERIRCDEVAQIKPFLAASFRDAPDDDLAVLTFWLIVAKPPALSPTAA